jgi:hypothetical protein
MRDLLRAIWRLRFKRRDGSAQKSNACHLSDVDVCLCGTCPSKPPQYSPKQGWRLLAHIGYTDTIATIDQTHDIELNEELLKRIDFLACLFGSTRIEP